MRRFIRIVAAVGLVCGLLGNLPASRAEDAYVVVPSSDGKRLLTGSSDQTALLWDASDGSPLRTLRGHTDPVNAVAFGPGGKRLLTGSRDGTTLLWDAGSGTPPVRLISVDAGQDWLVVTPEGLFDGSRGGYEKLRFRVGKGLTVLPVDRFLADYWQPGLLAKIVAGERPLPTTVVYDRPPVKPDLWVVGVGVSKYAEKDAELQFAAADARAMLRLFTERGKPLYAAIHATPLLDEQATVARMHAALQAAEKAHPRDTFVLFLSGHGVSVAGRYHFLPVDFRNQPGQTQEDDVRKQGLSADEVRDLLGKVPALKKVLILDTSNAGGALKMLDKLRTGKTDPGQLKKEVERLWRAEGIYAIATGADKQEAKEEKELGHGVLTYALLAAFAAVEQGPLQGEPLRPSGKDEVIDVLEWFTYAGKRMPELMKRYFDRYQDPLVSTERTNSFPILPAPRP